MALWTSIDALAPGDLAVSNVSGEIGLIVCIVREKRHVTVKVLWCDCVMQWKCESGTHVNNWTVIRGMI